MVGGDMDHTLMHERLAALQHEFSTGTRLLAEHDARGAAMREQLLRISGAIRVLTELLSSGEPSETAERSAAVGR
jgi:hypothetical protein